MWHAYEPTWLPQTTSWMFYHASFAEFGVQPMQLWFNEDSDGCTFTLGSNGNTEAGYYGTCEIELGHEIRLVRSYRNRDVNDDYMTEFDKDLKLEWT